VDGHHHDGHDHHHHDGRLAPPRRRVPLEQAVLAKNDRAAAENRAWLEARGVIALNLMSSPGAGKTTLLEHTVRALAADVALAVIEGDQETPRDAERIRAAGCRAVQINTGTGCHLDASMVKHALAGLSPQAGSIVFIENVGNLVCPALFDLGERKRVVIASVTEGEDKPLKYPHMFRAADLLLLNKVDLLPYVDVDAGRFIDHARAVNRRLEVLRVSAKSGEGLDSWLGWLRRELPQRAVG
jgi:hydrogenase nickel incorporation protein HypB